MLSAAPSLSMCEKPSEQVPIRDSFTSTHDERTQKDAHFPPKSVRDVRRDGKRTDRANVLDCIEKTEETALRVIERVPPTA